MNVLSNLKHILLFMWADFFSECNTQRQNWDKYYWLLSAKMLLIHATEIAPVIESIISKEKYYYY